MTAIVKKRVGRPPDEALRERRQEEILDAAAKTFAQQGYLNTEVQQVADALQVGKGTIYRYYPSKEQLFLAAVDRGMKLLKEAVDQSGVGVADPLERVERAILAYLAFFRNNPQHVELLIQERAAFRDRKKPTYFEHRDSHSGPWEEMFQRLIAEGRVRNVNVAQLMDVISDMVYGAMFTHYFAGQHKPLEQQARDIIDICFFGILSDSERNQRRAAQPGGEQA
jgi:AcrR family transcriptional regulator